MRARCWRGWGAWSLARCRPCWRGGGPGWASPWTGWSGSACWRGGRLGCRRERTCAVLVDNIKAKANLPTKAQHQNCALGFRVKCVAIDEGGKETTLLPSLPPSQNSSPSLPSANLSGYQSLALLTPRLLQGTMSLQGVGRQTGLQEEVVRAWRDSIRRCLPASGGGTTWEYGILTETLPRDII